MNNSAASLLSRLKSATDPHGALSEFCRKSGLPRKTVENWLNGTTIPTTALDAIARGLETTPWQLLKPADAKESPLVAAIIAGLPALDEDKLRAILSLILAFRKDLPPDPIVVKNLRDQKRHKS